MAPQKTVERTAASSRPKRAPKPTTVAAIPAPESKPKKKMTVIKKAVTKPAASKRSAATKVTKKTALKKNGQKNAASKNTGATIRGAQKEPTTKNQKNPRGPEAQNKIDKRKEAEKEDKYKNSCISSPVKKAQSAIVDASPMKKAQDAMTRSRSKSPEKKKMTSNDSGYQADNEQQSVVSRTWELAANAVEAMKSAVNVNQE
ncbi:hypothetical protein QM012_003486 [Aureobasidium pullulans]|uniref:Histone-fold-containing protein n=1 Tax=Aureobasidium pullulans TaxID=5580 RepID=A0ABR0T9T1_AURPU